MKVEDITKWATNNIAEVDPQEVLRWANEARDLICLEYPPYKSISLIATDLVKSFALPADFMSIKKIRSNNADYSLSKISKPVPGYIEFSEVGIYDLYYGAFLDPMATNDSGASVGIHRVLAPLIFDYLMYKYYDNFAQGDQEESTFATKFYDYFNNKLAYLSGRLMEFENISSAPDEPVEMAER